MFSSLCAIFRGILILKKQQNVWVEFLNPHNPTGIIFIILKLLGKVNRGILFQYAGLIVLEFDQKLKWYEKETNIVNA